MHTPILSPSSSDYEWKRVENSRWNNLRGMWGKRAADGGGGGSSGDETTNQEDRFKELVELLSDTNDEGVQREQTVNNQEARVANLDDVDLVAESRKVRD